MLSCVLFVVFVLNIISKFDIWSWSLGNFYCLDVSVANLSFTRLISEFMFSLLVVDSLDAGVESRLLCHHRWWCSRGWQLKVFITSKWCLYFLNKKISMCIPWKDWTCVFSVIDRYWTEIFQVWRREEKISLQVDMRNLFSGMQI